MLTPRPNQFSNRSNISDENGIKFEKRGQMFRFSLGFNIFRNIFHTLLDPSELQKLRYYTRNAIDYF